MDGPVYSAVTCLKVFKYTCLEEILKILPTWSGDRCVRHRQFYKHNLNTCIESTTESGTYTLTVEHRSGLWGSEMHAQKIMSKDARGYLKELIENETWRKVRLAQKSWNSFMIFKNIHFHKLFEVSYYFFDFFFILRYLPRNTFVLIYDQRPKDMTRKSNNEKQFRRSSQFTWEKHKNQKK